MVGDGTPVSSEAKDNNKKCTDNNNANKIRERQGVQDSFGSGLCDIDSAVLSHGTREIQNQDNILGTSRGRNIPVAEARLERLAAAIVDSAAVLIWISIRAPIARRPRDVHAVLESCEKRDHTILGGNLI